MKSQTFLVERQEGYSGRNGISRLFKKRKKAEKFAEKWVRKSADNDHREAVLVVYNDEGKEQCRLLFGPHIRHIRDYSWRAVKTIIGE